MEKEWIDAMNAMQPNTRLIKHREQLFEHYTELASKQLPGNQPVVCPKQIFDFVENSGHVYNFVDSEDCLTIVTEEGDTMIEQLPIELVEQGVQLIDLNEALLIDGISDKIGNLVSTHTQQGAFHYLMMNHGLVLIIPDNVVIEQDIDIFKILLESEATLVQHLTIIIGKNSQVTFKEREENNGNRYVSTVTEVYLSSGSQVNYQTVSMSSEKIEHYNEHHFVLEKDSHLSLERLLTDKGQRSDFTSCDLNESGANVTVNLASITRGTTINTFDVQINHNHPHTESRLIQRGVTFDKSSLYMNANSYISEGAKQSQATQDSRILLMSQSSQGEVNPMLEIHNDEVKASHAASLSPMSEELLYYFMSRGIDEATARIQYAKGFLKEVISSMQSMLEDDFKEEK